MSKSKFYIEEKVDLSVLSEDWKDCYIVFAPFTVGEAKRLIQNKGSDEEVGMVVADLIEKHFIKGYSFDGEKRVKLTKEDMKDVPITIFNIIVEHLMFGIQKKIPKELKPSKT